MSWYNVLASWENERRETDMLAETITTVLDHLWYEIWQDFDGENNVFKAVRYDAEMGNLQTVAVEWKKSHAERMVRYDMARLGIA